MTDITISTTEYAVLHMNGPWIEYAKKGNKIEAIRSLRSMKIIPLDLKDAKDVVETYMANPSYYDELYLNRIQMEFKTSNGNVHIKQNANGTFVITEVKISEFTAVQAMEYIYNLGVRNGQPIASA